MFYNKELELHKAEIRLAAEEAKAGRVKHQGVIRKLERQIRNLKKNENV